MKPQLQQPVAVIALLVAALTSSGCAFLASANAAHSHISPCVDEIGYSIFDLILAAGATGALAGSGALDENPSSMLLPGVFVASGVIGSIFVYKCRAERSAASQPSQSMPVYPAVVEETPTSTLPDATPEELGLPSPTAVPPDPRLQLSPNSTLKDAPPKPPDPEDASAPNAQPPGIECGFDLPDVKCPQGQRCISNGTVRGTCTPESSKALAPKTELPPPP